MQTLIRDTASHLQAAALVERFERDGKGIPRILRLASANTAASATVRVVLVMMFIIIRSRHDSQETLGTAQRYQAGTPAVCSKALT